MKNEIQEAISSRFLPHAVILWKDAELGNLIPSHVDKNPIDGQTAIYICRQDLCEAVLIEKGQILKALRGIS